MIICVDLGNTTTALAVLEGTEVKRFWRIMTVERTSDEYAVLISSLLAADHFAARDLERAGICSVVPSETGPIAGAFTGLGVRPHVLDPTADCGIKVAIENPGAVGADRIANAVGAYYHYGGPAIVVDTGTATTFDVISAEGDYRGGVIAPGMLAGAKDLWRRTRMLPAVEIAEPARVVGTSTVTAMQSGIFFGAVGQVEGIIRRMWSEIGGQSKVIMTGGYAALIWNRLAFETVFDVNLTMKGVAYALDAKLRSGRKQAF
jgi:type III pantothenate kinase